MNKFIVALVIASTVSGCDSNISGPEVARANKFCADKGGVHSFDTIASVAWCRDGDGSTYRSGHINIK